MVLQVYLCIEAFAPFIHFRRWHFLHDLFCTSNWRHSMKAAFQLRTYQQSLNGEHQGPIDKCNVVALPPQAGGSGSWPTNFRDGRTVCEFGHVTTRNCLFPPHACGFRISKANNCERVGWPVGPRSDERATRGVLLRQRRPAQAQAAAGRSANHTATAARTSVGCPKKPARRVEQSSQRAPEPPPRRRQTCGSTHEATTGRPAVTQLPMADQARS